MPKGNPEGYLEKPKEVEKKLKRASIPPKAQATLDLEKKLEERRKKVKAAQRAFKNGTIDRDTYLKQIDGN